MDKKIEITKPEGLATPLSFFSDDEHFVYVFKKTQKLVSALYLITGFFKEDEPVRSKLRELGTNLLSESVLIKDGSSAQRDRAVQTVHALVLEITALLEVARQAGMMTEMNYNIVNKEFALLLESISHPESAFEGGLSTLKPAFFGVEKKSVESRPVTPAAQNDVHEETKDKTVEVPESRYLPPVEEVRQSVQYEKSASPEAQPNRQIYTPDVRPEPKMLKDFGAVAVKKNSRQSVIINLLKRKKEIMIKDVSPLIHGCSEKTIQRELLAMVQSGILKKEGEKRWSRYSLAVSE